MITSRAQEHMYFASRWPNFVSVISLLVYISKHDLIFVSNSCDRFLFACKQRLFQYYASIKTTDTLPFVHLIVTVIQLSKLRRLQHAWNVINRSSNITTAAGRGEYPFFFRWIIIFILYRWSQAPNCAARTNHNVRTPNIRNATKAKQPTTNTNLSINLESVPTATTYVLLLLKVFAIDRIFYRRPKAVPPKAMALPLKIFICSLIALATVGAIVGPSVYFGMAGNMTT